MARKSLLLLEKSGTLERSIVISERQGELPSPKRARRERTDEWAKIQQWTLARHPRMSLNVWGCEASFLRKSMGEHEKAA